MPRPEFTSLRHPEPRRAAHPGRSEVSTRRGRSGYGIESIRPLLRAQIAQRDLMRPPFPPPEDEPE